MKENSVCVRGDFAGLKRKREYEQVLGETFTFQCTLAAAAAAAAFITHFPAVAHLLFLCFIHLSAQSCALKN